MSKSLTTKDMYKFFVKNTKQRIKELEQYNERLSKEKLELLEENDYKRNKKIRYKDSLIYRYEREIESLKRALTKTDYKLYRKVICSCNKKTADYILKGGIFPMGNHLSTLFIKRAKRNFNNKRINWKATHEYKKKTGKKKYVYFTDKYWYRWGWNKRNCSVKNRSVYSFRPTRGENGNTKRLARLLNSNPNAHIRFIR